MKLKEKINTYFLGACFKLFVSLVTNKEENKYRISGNEKIIFAHCIHNTVCKRLFIHT